MSEASWGFSTCLRGVGRYASLYSPSEFAQVTTCVWRGRTADIPVAPPFAHELAGVEEWEGGEGRALRLALDDVLDLVVPETADRHEEVAGGQADSWLGRVVWKRRFHCHGPQP